jgi:hypothetical protein
MTVIAEIESYTDAAKNLDEAGLEKLKVIFPEANKKHGFLYGVSGTVDLDLLMEICSELELKFSIKPHKGNVFWTKSRNRGIEKRLDHLETDFNMLKSGSIIQMHVPNFALLTFNQVEVEENCCTEQLQRRLNDGWRIMAVCPPLDERRPAYILGRYVPA